MRRVDFPPAYARTVQRLRVPVGFLLGGAFLWFADPSFASIMAGLPICVAGLALRAWAAGHLAKNEALAVSGPYRYVRNPLYLGTLLGALGLALAGRAIWLGALFAAIFFLVYLPAIGLEEQRLRELFPQYEQYARRTPMLIPRFRSREPSARFRWSLYCRNEEQRAALGFLAAAAVLIWKAAL